MISPRKSHSKWCIILFEWYFIYIFHDFIAVKGPFSGGNVGQKSENLSLLPIFALFVHNLWFLWERIVPSDRLSDLNGILYVFHDSIAIKGQFPGGNVGQKHWNW